MISTSSLEALVYTVHETNSQEAPWATQPVSYELKRLEAGDEALFRPRESQPQILLIKGDDLRYRRVIITLQQFSIYTPPFIFLTLAASISFLSPIITLEMEIVAPDDLQNSASSNESNTVKVYKRAEFWIFSDLASALTAEAPSCRFPLQCGMCYTNFYSSHYSVSYHSQSTSSFAIKLD